MKIEAICLALLGGLVACSTDVSDDLVAAGEDASIETAQVTGTLRALSPKSGCWIRRLPMHQQ
jgi:hypothetical protein